jgi:cytochrome c553
MGMTRTLTALGLAVAITAGGALAAPDLVPVRSGGDDAIEVKLCDDETTVQIAADTPKTRAEGRKIADALMSQWQQKHPEQDWIARERERHQVNPPADTSGLVGKPQGQVYGQVTPLDVKTWERETLAMAVHGSTVFHSGDELGSSIAVSCDMCHPDAANTHPETYPKFQVQLGRVALLRDMINWCIEHPVRGTVLAPDDPKMRALEAYILAQRKGKALDYGKR